MSAWKPPAMYDDPPGTVVEPVGNGYEAVTRPDRAFLRKTLSPAGRRKYRRLAALTALGWQVESIRGAGWLRHPSEPGTVSSIAAAARLEGLK